MMAPKIAAREMTWEEWAARLFEGASGPSQEQVAQALAAAEARGRGHERRECADLARQHATTIDEVSIAETPFGLKMTEQERINIAAEMRHVAQYIGALISVRGQGT